MKTNGKLLLVIGLFAAMAVGFIIGILVEFPIPKKSDISGTFGKADKYRKVRMTAKDVQLRSELLKDTAQLKSMVSGLVYFSVFTEDVSNNIDAAILAFHAQGMGTGQGEAGAMKALQDYTTFIRNNNNTLNSTITLLSGYYLGDTLNLAQDVEKNLRDFSAYVNSLNQKSSILSQALGSMDDFMLGELKIRDQKEEVQQLKLIRDQLMIKGFQLGGLLGNQDMVNLLLSQSISAQDQLNSLFGTEQLGQLAALNGQISLGPILLFGTNGLSNQQGLQRIMDRPDLQSTLADKGLGLWSAPDLKILLYDQTSLQLMYSSREQLGPRLLSGLNGSVNVLAFNSSGKLNLILNNFSLQSVMHSQLDRTLMNTNTLGRLLSLNDLQNVFFASDRISSMFFMLGSENQSLMLHN